MRTIYKLAPVVIILLAASCKKFLQENVYSNISQSNFWQTSNDALAGLHATYTLSNQFGAHDRTFFVITDMLSDDMDDEYSNTEVERRQLQTYSYSPFNSYFNTAWVELYKAIAQANAVIGKVPAITSMAQTDRNTVVGEARFLRALEYFYLVQLWGGVPEDTIVVSDIASTLIPKSPADSIYSLIVQDLQFAENNCADSPPETGRATKWAAKALLGKVYLTMAGPFTNRNTTYLTLAEAELRGVINSKKFSLVPHIIDYFDVKKKGSAEAIYEEWALGDVSESLGSFMHRNALPTSISDGSITQLKTPGYKAWSPTPDLWSHFLPDDDRLKMYYSYYIKKSSSSGTYSVTPYNVPYIAKYVDSTTIDRDWKANNLPIIRYSDVLLLYAEVLNELGIVNTGDANHDQYYYLNLVRQRAYSSNPSAHVYADMSFSQSQFRDSLMLERRLELAHEGQRLFDMRRTGTYISGMDALAASNASRQSSPPTFTATYPGGVYPNPSGPKPYPGGTITFLSNYFLNTKMVGPQPFQALHPIPGSQLQIYNIGQNPGY
jgi:hypothetical protein